MPRSSHARSGCPPVAGLLPNARTPFASTCPLPPQGDAIKAWKAHLTATAFTFVVDCRGRATLFNPTRTGRSRPMECTECLGLDHYKDECPIVTSSEFCTVHITRQNLTPAVGTSLGTIRDNQTQVVFFLGPGQEVLDRGEIVANVKST
ncbi:hypothetical protein B0H13DRAFT_1903290 [Mycena leptocephala]|nr:hypothetical protein B0H13DRAFT_1903290 [Mycena leptocephala]